MVGIYSDVANPFDRSPLSVYELPQDEIVLQGVGTDGQVVAVRLQIEQNTRALVNAPRQRLEAHADLAVPEVLDPRSYCVGVVREGLHVIEEFRVTVAVECARFVRDIGSRLSLFPAATVYHQDLAVAVLCDGPDADNRRDGLRLGANCFCG